MIRTVTDRENLLSRWARGVGKPARLAFCAALLAGLAVHLYMLTGKYPNHDDIVCLFENDATVTSGRWLLYVLDRLGTGFSLPWANGLASLIALGCIAALTTSLYGLERKSHIVLWAAALAAFPSVGNLFAFMFTSDGYCLGFLLAALAGWLADRKKWGCLLAAPLMMLALAAYQATAAFLVAMLAVRGLQRLLKGDCTNREIGRTAASYALTLILGTLMYLASNKLALVLTHQTMEAYTGLDTMGKLSLSALPGNVLACYKGFVSFLFLETGRYTGIWMCAAHLLMGLLSAGMIGLVLIQRKNASRLQAVLALALTALLPMLLYSMPLFGAPRVHVIMAYSAVFSYALALVLYQLTAALPAQGKRRTAVAALSWAVALSLAFCSFRWYLYTNQGYLALQLKYENMYSLCLRMTDRVENSPGYTPGMPVAYIGEPGEANYPPAKDGWLGSLGSAEGFGSPSEFAFLYDDRHFHDFVNDYIGVGFASLDGTALAALEQDPRVLDTPCYPEAGSVFVLDGVLVIHAGEVRS